MEKNRDELNKKYKADKNLFGKFKEEFEVSENDLKELIEAGEKEGVKLDSIQYGKSKNLIKKQIKANIARDMWESGEYFQIMNTENDIYMKALEVLSSKKNYEAALLRKKDANKK
jgi:carboxyl-terminal processing protease